MTDDSRITSPARSRRESAQADFAFAAAVSTAGRPTPGRTPAATLLALCLLATAAFADGARPPINAHDFLVAAAAKLVEKDKLDDALFTLAPKAPNPFAAAPGLATKRRAVEQNREALELIHKALAWPYAAPEVANISAPMPYLAQFRSLGRLLRAEAQVAAADEDWGAAAQIDLDCVAMGGMVPRGAPLIGLLVGLAIESVGARDLWPILPHLSPGEARAAAHRLELLIAREPACREAAEMERRILRGTLDELLAREDWRETLQQLLADQNDPALNAYLEDVTKERFVADLVQSQEAAAAAVARPWTRATAAEAKPTGALGGSVVDSTLGCHFKATLVSTRNSLLLSELALHACHAEKGAWPETLDALVPEYLWTVPLDPFTPGAALAYRREGDGHVLYSVGPDGRDDGGQAIAYNVEAGSDGDLMAGVNP
ncbi:MAG: hypothetical protein HYU66_19820 [Armatimonadetes bacterium]|nr:hypothetical protein [Armatimonadota bacterium]